MNNIKVKYHNGMEEYPLTVSVGNAGIDLYAAEDVILKQGEFKLINLGVSMALPKGYWGMLLPRSSTYKKWGIIQTNSCGVIDETYQGDGDIWRMPALALRDTVIKRGDRIAQFVVMPDITRTCSIEKVDHLSAPDRGGFGSTGSHGPKAEDPHFSIPFNERTTPSNK